jgi:putative solute:sodium symporter small subunit
MQLAEIIAGAMLLAIALILPTGLADHIMPLSAFGLGAGLILAMLGAVMLAHGLVSRRLAGLAQDQDAVCRLRARARVLWTLVVSTGVVIAVPYLTGPLNLVTVAGFPLGYFMAAQGALLLLTIIAFRAARRLDTIDFETGVKRHPPAEEP